MWLATTRSSVSAARSGAVCARAAAEAQERSAVSASAARVPARQRVRMSEPLDDLRDVLDLRRVGEAVADQLAPFREIGRAAEIDRVVLDRVPLHEQPVAHRLFDRALQRHAGAAFGTLEQGRRLLHAGFELGFHAGLHVDLRDLEEHDGHPCRKCCSSSASTLPPTQVGLARLAHSSMPNSGKPEFGGGEGRPPSRSDGGRGGGTTVALSKWRPPPPAPPRHSLRSRGEGRRSYAAACSTPRLRDAIVSSTVCTSPKLE